MKQKRVLLGWNTSQIMGDAQFALLRWEWLSEKTVHNCNARNNHLIFHGLKIGLKIVSSIERQNDSIKIGEVLVYLGHYVESTVQTVTSASIFVGFSFAIGPLCGVCKFSREHRISN